MAIFEVILNIVQIYEENGKVVAKSFDMTSNLPKFEIFKDSKRENLSLILFPDKTKNLQGKSINVFTSQLVGSNKNYLIDMWNFFIDIIVEKLNATMQLTDNVLTSNSDESLDKYVAEKKLDLYLEYQGPVFELRSHYRQDVCFVVPLPNSYSIAELILFLPLDQSCWMWLGITIAVSTFLWRFSESHWHFPFGAFAIAMYQTQLNIRVRT